MTLTNLLNGISTVAFTLVLATSVPAMDLSNHDNDDQHQSPQPPRASVVNTSSGDSDGQQQSSESSGTSGPRTSSKAPSDFDSVWFSYSHAELDSLVRSIAQAASEVAPTSSNAEPNVSGAASTMTSQILGESSPTDSSSIPAVSTVTSQTLQESFLTSSPSTTIIVSQPLTQEEIRQREEERKQKELAAQQEREKKMWDNLTLFFTTNPAAKRVQTYFEGILRGTSLEKEAGHLHKQLQKLNTKQPLEDGYTQERIERDVINYIHLREESEFRSFFRFLRGNARDSVDDDDTRKRIRNHLGLKDRVWNPIGWGNSGYIRQTSEWEPRLFEVFGMFLDLAREYNKARERMSFPPYVDGFEIIVNQARKTIAQSYLVPKSGTVHTTTTTTTSNQ